MPVQKYDLNGNPVTPNSNVSKGITYYTQTGAGTREARYPGAIVTNGTALTTGAPAVGTLFAFPFIYPRGGTIDIIACNVTTLAVGATIRIGIYNNTSDTDLYPSSLVYGSAELSGATTGVKQESISVTLLPNTLYWSAYLCGTLAPTVRCYGVANLYPIGGYPAALGTAAQIGITVALAYAALPATFTAAGTWITAVPLPEVAIRYAS